MKSYTYRIYLTLLWVLLSAPVHAETLNVAVASNFAPTLKLLAREFERQSGHRVQVIGGSSGAHYAQIINGAPFDLFLSADSDRPAALTEAGIVTASQLGIYALGRLALWSRDPVLANSLDVVGNLPAGQRVAIANPRLAPYGNAAMQTLDYLGFTDRVASALVMGENVGQTFQFIHSGNAIVGFVAYSQVLSAPVAGSYSLVPDAAYEPIVQVMVLLRPSEASQAFFDYLLSDKVNVILEEAGYYAPAKHP